MNDLIKLTATEAAEAIRTKSITSEELVTACLVRIAKRDAEVQAWAHLDRDLALRAAREADQAVQKAEQPLKPLHGVPVGVKDIVDTVDWPTENGTELYTGRRPPRDAEIVTRLKASGAVILGKTVTTELAFFGPGKTRNPHNSAHTPGGSSSGSAAAVADFQVPLAVGTQTAGSIIRPASYCGVVGFKPTYGRVPVERVLTQSPPLDTIGGYGRTPRDAALLVEAMGGPAAPTSSDRPATPRFAFIKTDAWLQGDESMRDALQSFVASLGGAAEETILPAPFEGAQGLQRAVQFHDIAANYGPLYDANPDKISAKLADVISVGRSVSASEYGVACARREGMYEALGPLFDRFDAIITPAAAGAAPEGLQSTGSPMFNFLWTYLGCPAISLPLLSVDGLPLGVQIVGRRDRDAELVLAAEWLMARAGR